MRCNSAKYRYWTDWHLVQALNHCVVSDPFLTFLLTLFLFLILALCLKENSFSYSSFFQWKLCDIFERLFVRFEHFMFHAYYIFYQTNVWLEIKIQLVLHLILILQWNIWKYIYMLQFYSERSLFLWWFPILIFRYSCWVQQSLNTIQGVQF